jgi:hypothetical protein
VQTNTGWTIEEMEFDFRQGKEIFLFFITSRASLVPTQPHIQWVPRAFSWGQSGRSMKLTIHIYLVLRLRVVEIYISIPPSGFMTWCFIN